MDPGRLDVWAAPEGGVQVEDAATRDALVELVQVAPQSLAWAELARRVGAQPLDAMRQELFDLWLATGALDLHVFEARFTASIGDRPRACSVARWHAEHGGTITNRWHQEVRLPDTHVRRVLGLLDGTRAVDEIVRETGIGPALVRTALELVAASSLLVG
jgi:hypothetical protein